MTRADTKRDMTDFYDEPYETSNETQDFYSDFYNVTAAPTAATVPPDAVATYLHEARFGAEAYVDEVFQSNTFRRYASAKLQYAAASRAPVEIVGVYKAGDTDELAVDFVSREHEPPPEGTLNAAVKADNRYGLGPVRYIANFNGNAYWSLATEHRCSSENSVTAQSIHECYKACAERETCSSFSYGPDRVCAVGSPACQGIYQEGLGRIYGLKRDVPPEESNELVLVIAFVMFVVALGASVCAVCALFKRESLHAANFLHASMLDSGRVSEVSASDLTETSRQ